MKIIVTKYATSSGVQIRNAELSTVPFNPTNMVVCNDQKGFTEYFHGKDWHKDSVSAHNDVVERFRKKRNSLAMQLSMLDVKLQSAIETIKESGL